LRLIRNWDKIIEKDELHLPKPYAIQENVQISVLCLLPMVWVCLDTCSVICFELWGNQMNCM